MDVHPFQVFGNDAGFRVERTGWVVPGREWDGGTALEFGFALFRLSYWKDISIFKRKSLNKLPACPKCKCEYTYEDGSVFVCPECAHEWTQKEEEISTETKRVVRDANGNTLNDGDFVTVIKNLKVKGSSTGVKIGTKVKIIRLVEGDHEIDCKIEGIGAMMLKSEFVKKA